MTSASSRPGAFDTARLLALMSDISRQPDWRSMANLCGAYYDSDQLPPDVVATLKARGQPTTVHNLIGPTIDAVLGMEAKSRSELMVIADDVGEEVDQLAEALNAQFADMCRLGGFDRARSDGYASQIKYGIGWIEVVRNRNPFGPRYRFQSVHRDEVYWDWFTTQPDLFDCRWLLRRRWVDVDEAQARFPSKADILSYSVGNHWSGVINTTLVEGLPADTVSAFDEWQQFTARELDWCSLDRQRVLLQVVYYRTYTPRTVLTLDNGMAIAYDPANLLHQAALHSGRAQLERCPVPAIREAWFAGPHFLFDRPCSAPNNQYPLVPLWGYRKDRSREPYGLIARAIPAQNEVNLRRIKLTWLLQAKRVIADQDATNMSREQLLEEVERADGYIELNPNRRAGTAIDDVFKVEQDFQVAAQQFQVMQDSMKLVQDTMGVYAAFLGQGTTGQSGVAISNLVEQGATTLSEINDNYRFGVQLLGGLALGYLLEDLKARRNYPVVIHRDDKTKRKMVMVNVQGEDGTLSNDISRLKTRIALAPVQQTSAYRQQLAERMTNAMAHLPPPAQAACFDLLVELMDVPNKQEFVQRVRAALHIEKAPDEMTPQEQQAAAQQAQLEQTQQMLSLRELQAKVAKLEADAQKGAAEAARLGKATDSMRFDDALKQAQTGLTLQQMEALQQQRDAMAAELAQVQAALMHNIQAQIDAIKL